MRPIGSEEEDKSDEEVEGPLEPPVFPFHLENTWRNCLPEKSPGNANCT